MNIIQKISIKIKLLIYSHMSKKQQKLYMKMYPDYKGETEYDCGIYKFVWGVKSLSDMSQAPACLHTINDVDVIYSREKKRYILGIETAVWFDNKKDEVAHLTSLLEEFTNYMTESNLSTSEPYKFWMSQPHILFEGETIQELYTNFRIFVEGYKAVYERDIACDNKTNV